MKEKMREKAARYFVENSNCCKSILLAADETWSLQISQDLIAVTDFFPKGMFSGCTCGALVGAEMVLGIIQKRNAMAMNPKLANQLYKIFVATFGSCCCRVLRKKHSILERFTHEGCKKITADTAGILYDLVEKLKNISKC